MKFKIGDTVRIIYGHLARYNGKLGILKTIDNDFYRWPYNVFVNGDMAYAQTIEHITLADMSFDELLTDIRNRRVLWQESGENICVSLDEHVDNFAYALNSQKHTAHKNLSHRIDSLEKKIANLTKRLI